MTTSFRWRSRDCMHGIQPSYQFTTDGKVTYSLREDYVAGMEKLEKHQAVKHNVRFLGVLAYEPEFAQSENGKSGFWNSRSLHSRVWNQRR